MLHRRSSLVLSLLLALLSGCDNGGNAPPGDAGGGGTDTGGGGGTVDAWTPPPETDAGPTGETGRMVGMVAAHNAARDSVGASPAIPHVSWDANLAMVAQQWTDHLAATGCGLNHSGGMYGENLAWFSGSTPTPQDVVDLWHGELACYTYGTFMGTDACSSACSSSGGCGHYTQLVWRDTTRIGCAFSACPGGEEIWACEYDPPGNYLSQLPY